MYIIFFIILRMHDGHYKHVIMKTLWTAVNWPAVDAHLFWGRTH